MLIFLDSSLKRKSPSDCGEIWDLESGFRWNWDILMWCCNCDAKLQVGFGRCRIKTQRWFALRLIIFYYYYYYYCFCPANLCEKKSSSVDGFGKALAYRCLCMGILMTLQWLCFCQSVVFRLPAAQQQRYALDFWSLPSLWKCSH